MIANLTNEAVDTSFEVDSRRYGITAATYSTISSTRRSHNGKAEKGGTVLKMTKFLALYEVIAVV